MRFCLLSILLTLALAKVSAANKMTISEIINSPQFIKLTDNFSKSQFIVNSCPNLNNKQKFLVRCLLWRYLNKHIRDNDEKLKQEIVKVIKFSVKHKVSTPNDWITMLRTIESRNKLLNKIQQGQCIPNIKEAIMIMPCYYQFLKHLKTQGYSFWSFTKYWYADKAALPSKLIVIRHDVHYRDIGGAYAAYLIENELLSKNDVATYYVMWNAPGEKKNRKIQSAYLRLILFLKKNGIDVQPHISPVDLYFDRYPDKKKRKDIAQLRKLFEANYRIKKEKNGINYEITGEDVLGLRSLNKHLPEILRNYNREWQKNTKLQVSSYAAHGTPTTYAKVFRNSDILNQIPLLKQKIYQFDTYNTVILNKLTYLSDNTRPYWIEFPELVHPGQYELLMHPYVWCDKMSVQPIITPRKKH